MAFKKTSEINKEELEVTVTEEETKETEKKESKGDLIDKLEVDVKANEDSVRKEGLVRVRMREDHKCIIAMEKYDLKKGQCYNVPENVKRILSEHGLLAPLN